MDQRIRGFDIARAYAILGMFIVNFTFCFSSFGDQSWAGRFTSLFVGNSTSIFIMCAGIGVIMLSGGPSLTPEEKKKRRSRVIKRSWFLFGLGILLYSWWPGDILHFYGGYMHIAAFLLFIPRRYYLWFAALAIIVYNVLQFFIPITTSWNMQTTQYQDFWTPLGFLRNTFYNGWNSIFPWFAYFAIGMFLGKLNWQVFKTQRNVFLIGLALLVLFKGLRIFIQMDLENPWHHDFYMRNWSHLMDDYFPANLPYLMITTGYGLMIISLCVFLGNRFANNKLLTLLSSTGQMTLTHYVFHTTLGMMLLAIVSGHTYTGLVPTEQPLKPLHIMGFSLGLFLVSVCCSYFWSKRFKKGPLEGLMRKISG